MIVYESPPNDNTQIKNTEFLIENNTPQNIAPFGWFWFFGVCFFSLSLQKLNFCRIDKDKSYLVICIAIELRNMLMLLLFASYNEYDVFSSVIEHVSFSFGIFNVERRTFDKIIV